MRVRKIEWPSCSIYTRIPKKEIFLRIFGFVAVLALSEFGCAGNEQAKRLTRSLLRVDLQTLKVNRTSELLELT